MWDNQTEWGTSLPTPSDDSQSQDAAPTSQPLKRHAACDECRKRKLKCSGEPNGCSRCVKQSLSCHYSVQKQMGRPPKKRAREDDDELPPFEFSGDDAWLNVNPADFPPANLTPPGATGPVNASHGVFPEWCPLPVTSASHQLLSTDENHNHSWQLEQGQSFSSVPETTSPWPDFTSVTAAMPNPFTTPPGLPQLQSPPVPFSHSQTPSGQCTCLSYLYLCLSHLSSLASFPISQHTLCSLFIASRTAQAVIRCRVCPTRFATGMQNVMFTGTLLNVIADAWLRVSKTDPVELGRQAAPPAYVSALQNSPNPTEAWADWLRQTVRSSLLGTPSDEAGSVKCSQVPSLLSCIIEMENRQRSWHQSHPLSPSDSPNQADLDCQVEEENLLCIRVARSAREVIAKFGFEPHEYPNGVVA
ncbi:hypothetical protein P168DRAFT_275506 [Aspergillus campestris IBT 28561]|uniref:Zn(2)-C6 fungal-type domain-containing protein n=1 Tax=Aspergillus campestris (strain IBT 28561) TaxID=1392248 RepID=A0A2I1CTH7_ASPC2|nr:uncharacterized protein P168DRAFT_275506 [Aspergillus campestris IBT 28561]PKY00915.1 hypothetical protein P168DRAFT_275506 [Aspergillus campestris IBT 28561]